MDPNYYGQLRIPGINITLEQLILILYPSFLVPAIFFWYAHLQRRKIEATAPTGCVKLGVSDSSHMTDEYDGKFDTGSVDESLWRVKAIHVHPIKSCGSVELDEAVIEGPGMTWDRKFAFAELLPQNPGTGETNSTESKSLHKWTIRTLRNPGFEKLALVRPEIWVPRNSTSDKSKLRRIEQTGALVIRYPNVPSGILGFLDRALIRWGLLPEESSFQVPLTPPDGHAYPREIVSVWKDDPLWLNYGVHVPADLRAFLGAKHELTLFRADPQDLRNVFRNAPRKEQLGYQSTIGFADAYPLHILNLASVHDVGKRLKESIPKLSAKRFRSNLLLTGMVPYDEDSWKRISITSSSGESHEYYCACHTMRCRLPNVDPETAVRHPVEPDKTLKSFRCIDEGDPKNACLGLQIVPADLVDKGGKVTVHVGDTIRVLERGKHVYIRPGQ